MWEFRIFGFKIEAKFESTSVRQMEIQKMNPTWVWLWPSQSSTIELLWHQKSNIVSNLSFMNTLFTSPMALPPASVLFHGIEASDYPPPPTTPINISDHSLLVSPPSPFKYLFHLLLSCFVSQLKIMSTITCHTSNPAHIILFISKLFPQNTDTIYGF